MAISPRSTLVDYLLPARESRSINLLKDFGLIIGASIFVALCAQVSFHIPTTPVPITLQTFGVLLTGAVLGKWRAGLALLAYLAEGASGLPVFSGGSGGVIQLLGFTGGYLWAFPLAAFVTGFLCERGMDRRFLTAVLAMLIGSLIIYASGVAWLAFVGIPTAKGTFHPALIQALNLGMLPFIPGDLIKILIAASILPVQWTLLRTKLPVNE